MCLWSDAEIILNIHTHMHWFGILHTQSVFRSVSQSLQLRSSEGEGVVDANNKIQKKSYSLEEAVGFITIFHIESWYFSTILGELYFWSIVLHALSTRGRKYRTHMTEHEHDCIHD